jgi:cytidine deaminase
MTELDSGRGNSSAEDAKLVTLARATRARTGAQSGAAVRDSDGRTYAAASVNLPSLTLSALQVAVAMAMSSGAAGLEAAVVLADRPGDAAGAAAVHDVTPSVSVFYVDGSGASHA